MARVAPLGLVLVSEDAPAQCSFGWFTASPAAIQRCARPFRCRFGTSSGWNGRCGYAGKPSPMIWFWLVWLVWAAPEVATTAEIVEKPYSLLYFYEHGCRFCAAFDSDFEHVAQLYNHNANFQAVRVNAKLGHLADLFAATLYPSLKLYNHEAKQVVAFSQPRTVDNLREFIETNTGATPKELPSNVHVVSGDYFPNNSVIAFVSETDPDWATHSYLLHFFQRLLREHDCEFALVIGYSELMRRFCVSNVPSLVFVHNGSVKVHQTLSTNHMTNYYLAEAEVRAFVEQRHERGDGWFPDLDALHAHAAGLSYEGHRQQKRGMNAVADATHLDEAAQYAALLARVEL